MLVLSRKVGQSLVIADGVTVTVSEIGIDYVRLTVEAPNEADVRRRYPQALDIPTEQVKSDRPIVVTLTLHDGALLDRLRRRMSGDETLPPARDVALSAILQTVAESDDLRLPHLSPSAGAPQAAAGGNGRTAPSHALPEPPPAPRRRATAKPR